MPPTDAIPFSSQPFTFTNSIDTQSFQSIFTTMSLNANNPPGSASLSPEQSSLAASFASMMAGAGTTGSSSQSTQTQTSGASSTLVTSAIPSQSGISSQAIGVSSASGSSQITSAGTVVATSTASQSKSSATSNSSQASAASTASSAASNSGTDLQQQSSGVLSSPGLRAAVAVSVVLVGLAIIALIIFCVKRRKRRAQDEDTMEKMPAMSDRKKKWSRHLRIFSFDTELLMGGRFSSTNSIRSRQTGSVRSQTRSQHTPAPSEHSVESEVAPPYRDALAAGSGAAAGAAAARAGHAPSPLGRSVSNATAPPPYLAAGAAAAGGAESVTDSHRPTSSRSNRDPFADTMSPISPVDVSPFNDPETPALSRNSSLYHSNRDETSTIDGASDAGSIREATLARNASVMSGGRIIQNVNQQST